MQTKTTYCISLPLSRHAIIIISGAISESGEYISNKIFFPPGVDNPIKYRSGIGGAGDR